MKLGDGYTEVIRQSVSWVDIQYLSVRQSLWLILL